MAKVGRNEPCNCGSGRKFKLCHGATATGRGPAPSAVEPRASTTSVDEVARRAKRLFMAGHFKEAIAPLSQLVRLLPNHPAVVHDLGVAYHLTGRSGEAIPCFQRAIALEPSVARAHYHLGLALARVGDFDAALVAHHRASGLAPGMVEAHGRAGDILLRKGRRDEAVAAFRQAAAAGPETTVGALCEAKALVAENRAGEAEEALGTLLSKEPSNGEAHLALGNILNERGRFGEAAPHYERAIERAPSIAAAPWAATAYHRLVSARRVADADRPLLARIVALLEAGDVPERQRVTLHFAAGKALDDLGDYAGAMRQFDAANEIRRRVQPFDRQRFEGRVDRLIAHFTREHFARNASLGSSDETPILIIGMPRSGTTLTERVISSHPSVAGGGELPFWNERGPAWVDAEADALTEAAPGLREDYLRLLRGIGPKALRVTDKMPFNFFWAGLVHLLFPRARFVHCRRNPVDTCLSIYSTHFVQNWGYASDRGDLAFYFRQYLRVMDHWRAALPSEQWLDMDYEEATAAPEVAARSLVGFCGLDWDAACGQPERNPDPVQTASQWQARQPIYRSSVERWRHYEPWLGELLTLLPQVG